MELHKNAIDLTGQRFGSLVAVEPSYSKNRCMVWLCACDCGTNVYAYGAELRNGARYRRGKMCPLYRDVQHIADTNRWSRFKSTANTRDYAYTIDFEEFKYITSLPCIYCGGYNDPTFIQEVVSGEVDLFTGIDREDNEYGYIYENCVSCCSVCNYAKQGMSRAEFAEWVTTVYLRLCK